MLIYPHVHGFFLVLFLSPNFNLPPGSEHQSTILYKIIQSNGNHNRQDKKNRTVLQIMQIFVILGLCLHKKKAAFYTCKHLCDSSNSVVGWVFSLFLLKLLPKHNWLHLHELLQLKGQGLASGFAEALCFLCIKMTVLIHSSSRSVVDHLHSGQLYYILQYPDEKCNALSLLQ